MSSVFGVCLKCNKKGKLTRHHVFPRRHFPCQPRPLVVFICRKPCHDKLEKLIPYKALSLEDYLRIHYKFFGHAFMQILAEFDNVASITAYAS